MKFNFVAVLSLVLGSAFAEEGSDPLSCVDPTIAAAFLSGMGYQGVPKISKDIPSRFDGIQNMEGLNHVGTSETNVAGRSNINLGLSSPLPVPDMRKQLQQFLNQKGWQSQRQPGMGGGGFKTPNQQSVLQFCSESHGMVNVIVREYDAGSIVNIMSYDTGQIACGANGLQAHRFTSDLHSLIPDLDLPPGASVTPTYNVGISSNSNAASTKASFSVDMTPVQVMAHFDQQIETQGWKLDSGWEGQRISGSAWVRTTDDKLSVGMLTLIAKEDEFAVRFEVQSMN